MRSVVKVKTFRFSLAIRLRGVAMEASAIAVGETKLKAETALRDALAGPDVRVELAADPFATVAPRIRVAGGEHEIYLDAIRAAAGLPARLSGGRSHTTALVTLLQQAGVDAVKVGMVSGGDAP